MSRYHNDRTRATDPGRVQMSEAKLRALEPELFSPRTFKCSPGCPTDHPAEEMRARFAEHLALGDSRAALVISLSPLVVAAYSDDLDAAVLLRFPEELGPHHGLTPGSRLLTVNTYGEVRDQKTGELWYAVDLVPGPARSAWSNCSPFIAEFLSDELDAIEARKTAIDEEEWARLA